MKNSNFAFFGTPEVASRTLEILRDKGFIPSVIVTSPDRRAGRGMHMTESPVSLFAKAHQIECLKPEKIDQEFIDMFKKYNVDLSIVIAYGKILPETLINMPLSGTINIHYSLLPKYRGASPVEEALLKGDTETGVSIQGMQFRLDSGPVLAEEKVAILENETKIELLARLTDIGGALLAEKFLAITEGSLAPKIQNESLASYSSKINKASGEIDPDADAKENWNKYRAFFGWPGVYFFKNKTRVKITKAKFENDSFVIERVIPAGKKEISYSDFLNATSK